MSEVKLVYGVGVNDATYKTSRYQYIDGKSVRVWFCPFYTAWKNMLSRCSKGGVVQTENPTYVGCSVVPEWHSFMAFRDWMLGQEWEDKQLDKDILVKDNQLYSPSTCVFISAQLNSFITNNSSAKGEYPMGVYWSKKNGKFKAQCSNPFTLEREYLGLFDCKDLAHEAWRKRKHEHAITYASMQTDNRIADALSVRFLQ